MEQPNRGFISGAWQKQPFPFGVSAIIGEEIVDLNAAAGQNILDGANVPAGELWVITRACARNSNTAITRIRIRVVAPAGIDVAVAVVNGPAVNERCVWNGWAVLGPGNDIDAVFEGCVLNDNIYFEYAGFRMDIDL